MNAIKSWSEIPEFSDENAEARFWENNELDGRLMATSIHTTDSRESTTITLRFDPRMLSRIKRIARGRFLNYQSMMKQWLAERLEDEMRKR
jgi:predicted DNA binding CopG/RHH family protein